MSVDVVLRVVEEGEWPMLALKPCCIACLKTAIPKRPKYDWLAYVCTVCFKPVPYDLYVEMVKEVQGDRQSDPS